MWRKFSVLAGLWMWAASALAADVNTASAQELMEIKGIGEATAQRIVEERAKGEFKNWDDFVTRTKGVGQAKAQKLSEAGLTVGNAPYAPSQNAKPEAVKADQKAPSSEKK